MPDIQRSWYEVKQVSGEKVLDMGSYHVVLALAINSKDTQQYKLPQPKMIYPVELDVTYRRLHFGLTQFSVHWLHCDAVYRLQKSQIKSTFAEVSPWIESCYIRQCRCHMKTDKFDSLILSQRFVGTIRISNLFRQPILIWLYIFMYIWYNRQYKEWSTFFHPKIEPKGKLDPNVLTPVVLKLHSGDLDWIWGVVSLGIMVHKGKIMGIYQNWWWYHLQDDLPVF